MDLEPILSGFAFIEGPRADEQGNLYFSDVMLGGIHKRSADGRVTSFLPDRKWIGGLALNENGGIVCSGHGGLWYVDERTGASRPLLDRIDGAAINAINDIQPDGSGGLYFGTIDGSSLAAGLPSQPGALFRLDPGGEVTKLWDDIPMSNGLGISPDGRTLYHSRTFEGIYAYDLGADGSLRNDRLIAPMYDSDGLAVDAEGGIWIAACRAGEIRRHLPSGEIERVVQLPVKEVLSMTFGGADLKDLYIVTAYPGSIDALSADIQRTATVFRVRSDIPGQALTRTRF